jgi:hypothetical protein
VARRPSSRRPERLTTRTDASRAERRVVRSSGSDASAEGRGGVEIDMPGCLNLGRARTAESRRAQAGQELEPRRIARRCWGERITDHTPVAHHGQVAFAACRLARRATRACRSRAGTRESTRLAARLPPSLHPAAAPRPTIAHCCFPCPGTLASASAVGAAAPLLPPECGTVGPAAGGCRNSSNSAARGHWRGRMSLLLQSRSSSLDVRFRCSSQGRSAGVGGRRARSREGGRRVLSRLSPLIGHSSGGCCGTRGAASTGKGARMQAECPQRVPFRTQHPLGVVVNRPSVWPDR